MITLGQTEIRYSLAVIKLFFAIFAFLAVNYPLHAATAAPTTIRVHSAPTTLMARRLGFKEIVNIGALKLPYPFMGLAIRRSAVQQNPDLVRGFLKAFLTGVKVAIEQPEASKRALAK